MEYPKGLQYIRTIERLRNISAAAKELDISQPALSSQLKKQEEILGYPIFDREHSPLAVTEAGKAYLDYAYELEQLQRKLEHRLSNLDNLSSGHLIIGAAGAFNTALMPKPLATFAECYPGVELEVVDGTIPDMLSATIRGDIDLFLTPTLGKDDGLTYIKLLNEKIFLCVPAAWEVNGSLPSPSMEDTWAPLEKGDLSKLAQHTFIALREGQHLGKRMKRLFKEFGFEPARTITVEQTLTALALTIQGVGISFITESTLKSCYAGDEMRIYLPGSSECEHTIYVAYPKASSVPRATQEFVRILKENLG